MTLANAGRRNRESSIISTQTVVFGVESHGSVVVIYSSREAAEAHVLWLVEVIHDISAGVKAFEVLLTPLHSVNEVRRHYSDYLDG